jgi:DNA modification methylase
MFESGEGNCAVFCEKAEDFLPKLLDGSVSLFILDPPYYGIVAEEWDNQWESEAAYLAWMTSLLYAAKAKLTPTGSLLMFGGLGKHGAHPFWKLCMETEKILNYRNQIAWKKRRAYGKEFDYLFCREEIVWFSKSSERTEVTFNIPLTTTLRGYAGFSKKYPAKSEYKRVSNVWDDIPELMRPARSCEKPEPLYERLIATHSDPGQLVADFFLGTGNSGVTAVKLGRRFMGCDSDPLAIATANERIVEQLEAAHLASAFESFK